MLRKSYGYLVKTNLLWSSFTISAPAESTHRRGKDHFTDGLQFNKIWFN